MTMNTILVDFTHTHTQQISFIPYNLATGPFQHCGPLTHSMIIQCPSSYKQSIFQSYDELLDQMFPTTSQPPSLQWHCKFPVDLADRLQFHIKHQGRVGRYVSHFHISVSVWNKNLNSISNLLSISTSKNMFFPNHFNSFSLLNTTHTCICKSN